MVTNIINTFFYGVTKNPKKSRENLIVQVMKKLTFLLLALLLLFVFNSCENDISNSLIGTTWVGVSSDDTDASLHFTSESSVIYTNYDGDWYSEILTYAYDSKTGDITICGTDYNYEDNCISGKVYKKTLTLDLGGGAEWKFTKK